MESTTEETIQLPYWLEENLGVLGYRCLTVKSPAPNIYTIMLMKNSDDGNQPNESPMPEDSTFPAGKTNNSLNVFVKCLDASYYSETMQETFEFEADLYFANEVIFYGRIIHEFLILQERFQANINIPFSSVSRCYHVQDNFIVLEDLVANGYEPLDMKCPMTYECSRVVIQQLARFHAFSFALKHHSPEVFDQLSRDLHPTEQIDNRILIEGMQDALKLAKQSFPRGSIYVDKLSFFVFDLFKFFALQKQKEGAPFSVVTHGDLWPSNIFCKASLNDNLKCVENAVFVDFQGCRLASPIYDLMSVVFLAIDKETRDNYRYALLDCYYSAMCLKLEELGVPQTDIEHLFPESALHRELHQHARYAFAMGLVGLPLYMQEDSNAVHNDSAQCETQFHIGDEHDPVMMYFRKLRSRKSMRCKNKMLELIMDVIDNGYLN